MSTLKVTNIQATGETASRPVSGVAAAFVNFNGTGTVAIRTSSNVSSITDVTTGNYTTNFSNNMDSVDYVVTAANGGDTVADNVRVPENLGSLSAGSFTVTTVITGASINDATYVFETIHGDLA